MHSIAKASIPIHVLVHFPTTTDGWRELSERVASVHADIVNEHIQKLHCSSEQKLQLLDSVIETASKLPGKL